MKKQFVSDTTTTPSEQACPECVRHPRCKNQWLDRGAGGNSTLMVINIPQKSLSQSRVEYAHTLF